MPATAQNHSAEGSASRVLRVPVMLLEQEWTLRYERTFDELIRRKEEVRQELRLRLERVVRPPSAGCYHYPIELEAVPLLAQVDRQKGEIGIYSSLGSTELWLERCGEGDREFLAHVRQLSQAEDDSAPLDLDLPDEEFQLPDFDSREFQRVYDRTLENEDQLLELIRAYRPGVMERINDFALSLTAAHEVVRNHLLRFLAILPSLDHDRGQEVKRILLESLRRLRQENRELVAQRSGAPLGARYIVPLVVLSWLIRLLPAMVSAPLIRGAVRLLARRFIAGENIENATRSLTELRESGREATLDQLGELVVSEREADGYRDRVLEMIAGFAGYVTPGQRNAAGIYSAHVSIKVTALASRFTPEAFDATYERVAPRLRRILIAAKEAQVFVNIDAEHYPVRDLVFAIYRRVLLSSEELQDYDGTGIVVQAYLRDAARHLEEVVSLARERGLAMPVRLVKGAYWDAETIEASAHSFKAPQFLNKVETDIYFRQLVHQIFASHPHLTLCLASHNIFDHAFARALHQEKFPELPPFEHQCLHMTFEALSTALAAWGVPTRNYVPVGSLLVGMAYLVRRIMENSSQVGFLTQMRDRDIERVLIPSQLLDQRREAGSLAVDTMREPSRTFRSMPPVQLYKAHQREAFFSAIESCRKSLPLASTNRFELGGAEHELRCPSDPAQVVGRIRFATKSDVDRALDVLQQGTTSWRDARPEQRAACLLRAGLLSSLRRLELAALVLVEAGKSMSEALADVDEAIDFLRLYAESELELSEHLEGLQPRGIAAVITPWNFPLAIPCGMMSAALVAGNTVALKSAEQSPLIAQRLVDILHEAGVPEDALIHLPGLGEEVGAALVEDKRVRAIAFTGSKAVGTAIARSAGSRAHEGRPTRVITEMGGKNAVIVTSSAELDETVAGTIYSAFAHAGQKCSALSRILVDASVKERFVERFAAAARDLPVGPAWDPATVVNPVITALDQERLREVARSAAAEVEEYGGRVHVDETTRSTPGATVGPLVVELPAERMLDPESGCRQEHFGPVVHVVAYESLDQAVELFNAAEYALTGGVFSQSQDDLDTLLAQLQAGNLYVNRSCTGARVGIEPFGGFKLSGTGPKAGHPEYLTAFHCFDPTRPLGGTIAYGHPEPSDPADALGATLDRLDAEPPAQLLDLVEGGQDHDLQTRWRDYLHWSRRNLQRWLSEGSQNVAIPGQISRDDFTLPRPSATLVLGPGEVHYTSWLALISGALLGARVRVIVDSETTSWRNKVEQLNRLGLQIELADKTSDLKSATWILDGPDEWLPGWLERIYQDPSYGTPAHPWMPQILTPKDCPHVRDYPAWFRRFVLVRSLAINTMRHGAPL